MRGSRLLQSEIAVLGDIVSRRAPELSPAVERIGSVPVDPADRDRIKRAIVDELCELPVGTGRRALELEGILGRLSE